MKTSQPFPSEYFGYSVSRIKLQSSLCNIMKAKVIYGGEEMGKTIRQTATFKASPHEVYEILMDEKKHAELSGGETKISRKAGGKVSIYDGEIEGKNLELVPDEKIVQAWRYSDWPEGHYSTATFSLEKVGKGTRLTFVQIDVPDDKYEDIKQGWKDYYWKPMKEMLEKS
jgi:activator of HSP90 ATPase